MKKVTKKSRQNDATQPTSRRNKRIVRRPWPKTNAKHIAITQKFVLGNDTDCKFVIV